MRKDDTDVDYLSFYMSLLNPKRHAGASLRRIEIVSMSAHFPFSYLHMGTPSFLRRIQELTYKKKTQKKQFVLPTIFFCGTYFCCCSGERPPPHVICGGKLPLGGVSLPRGHIARREAMKLGEPQRTHSYTAPPSPLTATPPLALGMPLPLQPHRTTCGRSALK